MIGDRFEEVFAHIEGNLFEPLSVRELAGVETQRVEPGLAAGNDASRGVHRRRRQRNVLG